MVNELLSTVKRERPTSGLHVRRARLQRAQAVKLLVDPFDGLGKYLLAFQRLLGGARKALSA